MNMDALKQLSLSQRTALEAAGWGVLVLALLLGLIFPGQGQLRELRADTQQVQDEVARIEALAGSTDDITNGLSRLKEETQRIDQRFPRKEETAVKAIAEYSRRHQLEIASLRMGAKMDFLDQKNKPVVLDGKRCSFVTVAVQAVGQFQDVVPLLSDLQDAPELFSTVEGLSLDRVKNGEGQLNVQLDLKIYLLN